MKILLALFSIISIVSATIPDLEESLKNISIPLVGIHWQVYANLNGKTLGICNFCVNCPQVNFIQENETDLFKTPAHSKSPIFYPCPSILDVETKELQDDLGKELKPDSKFQEKFYSGFTSFSSKGLVRDTNRILSILKNTKAEKQITLPNDFPSKVDVTKGKLQLQIVENQTLKTIEFDYEHKKGSEQTWIELSSKFDKRFLSMTRGHFETRDQVRETSSMWYAKEGLTRHNVFTNMVELAEMRALGCNCIKENFYTFDDVLSQLIKKCRNDASGYRKEIRVAAKLSKCLSKLQIKEYRQRLETLKNEL